MLFGVLELALVGRGATPLDQIFVVRSAPADFEHPAAMIRSMLLLRLNRDVFGVMGMLTVSAIVLACAFIEKGVGFQLLVGPLPGSVARRKPFLVQGEILIGISAAVWIAGLLAQFALRPDVVNQPIPNEYAVGAIAFWGSLAEMAWVGKWFALWRYVLPCVFAAAVVVEIYLLMTHHIFPTTIAASLVLGAAIFLAARWCTNRYA